MPSENTFPRLMYGRPSCVADGRERYLSRGQMPMPIVAVYKKICTMIRIGLPMPNSLHPSLASGGHTDPDEGLRPDRMVSPTEEEEV